MATLTTQADAIRSAVTSIHTCTPSVSSALKELLLGSDESVPTTKPAAKARTAKATQSAKTKTTATTKRATQAKTKATEQDGEDLSVLSPREKSILATQIINATLKSLGEAAKNPSARSASQSGLDKQTSKPGSRGALRRSNSMPMTPLQPRSLNRVITSPSLTKPSRAAAIPTVSSGCLTTVECARTAFVALRSLSDAGEVALPDLQLESGMSLFINRLLVLNLFEHALRELRLLKRRLEASATGGAIGKKPKAKADTLSTARTLSDLFEYQPTAARGPVLGLVTSSQIQALRIVHGLKKSAYMESALPFLQPNNQSSPLTLLLSTLKDEKPDRLKCARQMDNMVQSLLALVPNTSSKDDSKVMESKASPSAETALQLQSLALLTRLHSWTVSGHKGDVDKDVLLPLSIYILAYSRRSVAEPVKKLDTINAAFAQVWDRIEATNLEPSQSSKSPLATIYQALSVTARDANCFKDAMVWTRKVKSTINPQDDSPARCCAVTAQLITLCLQESPSAADESLLIEVRQGLQGSLSGSFTELDDLLVSTCRLRRAATNLIFGKIQGDSLTTTTREVLEAFILDLPRFTYRWLGKPPVSDDHAKETLRFEQRRNLLSRYVVQIIDSALMLVHELLGKKSISWDIMDPVLQDCLEVLERVGDATANNSAGEVVASHHVKISQLYYKQHMLLRQDSGSKKSQSIRALQRSIDTVKQRSEAEQSKAQLLSKQERLVELCRASGRKEDAADTLRRMRDSLIQEEVVRDVSEALSCQSVVQAWSSKTKAVSLSRAVCSLARLDHAPCDWVQLLSAADRSIALEHDLYFIYLRDAKFRRQLVPGDSFVETLLAAFDQQNHPIRRLRILLQLSIINLESSELASNWIEEALSLSGTIDGLSLGLDSGLAHYTAHLKALAACVGALRHGEPDSLCVRQALETWTSFLELSQSAADLDGYVDDSTQLITTLQGLADCARARALNTLLASILTLTTNISKMTRDNNPDTFLSQVGFLSLQHLVLGQSSKAEKVLGCGQQVLAQEGLSSDSIANFHLCSAEYEMAIGNFDRAEKCLADAHVFATAESREKQISSSRLARKLSMAYASFLHSGLCLERGQSHRALLHAKGAVRVLFQDWAAMEALRGVAIEHIDETSQTDQTELVEDDRSFNNSQCSDIEASRATAGPKFWALVCPLFRFVMRLSSIYAHVGMYQETMYYAEQAQRIAYSTQSLDYISQSQHWLASVFMAAGKSEKALELAAKVKDALPTLEPTYLVLEMTCHLSRIYREAADHATEAHLMTLADSMLQRLHGDSSTTASSDIESQMEKLSIVEKPVPKLDRPKKTRSTVTATSTKKSVVKKTAPTKTKMIAEPKIIRDVEDIQLAFLRAAVLQHKSLSLLDTKDWSSAMALLQDADGLLKLSSGITQERLLMAIAFVGQSLDLMVNDSVYSVLQDSTLSFPAIASTSKDKPERSQVVKATPPRKARAAPDHPGFLTSLQQAQDCLLEAHSLAVLNGSAALVHRIAALLQNVFILLSTTNPSKPGGLGHPAHATCSIEVARNLVWRRERKTLGSEHDKSERMEWPVLAQVVDPRRSSLGFSIDMNRFQRDFVDIIPRSWNVVSVSLSDDKRDLCITKLQADHSPFAIRLPLERASSRDADSEVFSFHEGRAEMLEIIGEANRTCHDARNISQKGGKSAWWAEREALDERMKELVADIEKTWLGGFRGIFAQHHRRTDLLARFQKSFQNILDKHLPSRQQVRGKRGKASTTTGKVSLDPRILDLFTGLGDATIPECDLDEPLTDLLYFVVDVLQFHGERNAYDEIDFDSMVLETFDALHSYHAAAKSSGISAEDVHTVLVLDKSLHIFPWESLPCMQGLAVSRIPSLACLRRSILEQRPSPVQHFQANEETETGSKEPKQGHYISPHSGSYILNPGGDLMSTQSTFAKPLANLPPTWSSIETRVPTEPEFEQSLSQTDLLLYFGHGSGAQYIRGRTIRKLEKCRAVAMLMGCSSASLADVGEFESHGPVWNYMLAGSPAVVGTLWDVTDRDIDRYAGRVFEEWGLMPKGTFAEDGPNVKGKEKASSRSAKVRGKKEAKAVEEESVASTSLVEAVAKARDACRLRYLTAAAVVVYGIPVYINK